MKALKVLLVFAFVFMPFHSALASGQKTFDHYIPTDIDEDYWAYEELDDFITADIIDGYMDEDLNMTVKPDNKITRAQFVKILVNALGLKNNGAAKAFPDVKQGDWFFEYVNIASGLGIINGKDDGTFAPNANITRDQMTKMIVLAFEKTVKFPEGTSHTFTDVDPKYWAFDYVNKAAASGIVKGYDTIFKPRNFATRAQAIVMIHRALQQEQSHLPSNEEITKFLKDHIIRENRLSESNSVDELVALYKENGIGYYIVEGIELAELPMDEEVGQLSIHIDDTNLNIQIQSKSDRFVTAKVTGMVGTFVFKSKDPNFNFDMTVDMDGSYKLKKDSASGKWKIYNYIPYFDEEELY
ncbi:S-layer homology domain-containing protein [Bacillus sp. FJAT-29790]|uniref:S-layer homology domain-containing protein n=1 Tax=Bacillus sp. FJAT-29790 TaxID=1895002 RepID=UPI001C214E44|nr:S-layer homology domain-containing protein [Bacillus sp. FJAT-29790]MBU8881139.1 S-layer homology domain-containing protein [Bacillus sp. FJAT-29790]